MRFAILWLMAVLPAAASLAGGAAEVGREAPASSEATPASVAVPAGNDLAFALAAEGVQLYACTANAGSFAWAFQAPEATLSEAGGGAAGKHYAGPTWEASDGSRVVGAKVEAATPDAAAIPWLLLRATSHAGSGRMADVTFVQRIRTWGGNAPPDGCDSDHVGAVARVPYRAVYRFYRKGSGAATR